MAEQSINVPITKGKASLEVDLTKLSDEVYKEVVLQGLKVLLNRGASKVTAASIPNEEARKAEAMTVAEKQLEMVYSGTIKFTGGKVKKATGAIMTEARRLAKAMVKDALKAAGHKVSHYKASEITKAANALLDTDQGKEIVAQAEANLKDRAKAPIAIDVTSLIKEDPTLVAKDEAEKQERKSTLSAKQAGMPKKRGDQPSAN